MTVFVTGATSGFGLAIARRFHAEGSRIVACGRRADRLDALGAELGERCHTIVLDVRDRDAVAAAFDALPDAFRPVRVLVNSAGLALGLEGADRADLDDWDTMVDTNVKGLMYCTRAALPGMVEAGGGHVVNVGSVAGSHPYPGGNVYGATKAFVEMFSLNLRADLVAKRVRVTNLEIGLAETEFSLVRFKGDADRAAAVYQGVDPIRADDVADAAWWAVSRPPHVNVNRIEIMAGQQAFGPFQIVRR